MTSDEILLDVEERMEKAVAKFKKDLSGVRTGRANPGLVSSMRAPHRLALHPSPPGCLQP